MSNLKPFKLSKSVIALLFLGLLMSSCYKSPSTEDLTYDFVVATEYDSYANFSNYLTYSISDTIAKISGNPNDSIITGTTALSLVNEIKSQMDKRGYTFVERDKNPDLALIASVIETTNVQPTCQGWWGGYPGYYPTGWWGWPNYGYWYPFCSYYLYDSGSFIIDMFDLKNTEENQNVKALWHSVSFGVLSSYDQTNLNLTSDAINQSFDQSPYIQR